MGADIHGVVEVDHSGTEFHSPSGVAYVEWPRSTELFVAMGCFGKEAMVPMRGLPTQCSFLTLERYAVRVCPDGEKNEHGLDKVIEQSEALRLVEAGSSHRLSEPVIQGDYISDDSFAYPNWITTNELKALVATFKSKRSDSVSMTCEATISFMEHFESHGVQTRLVYWFDL